MKAQELSMQVLNPHAAGIDVGSRFHMVAVGQNVNHVKKFGVYTSDHQELICYLTEHGVTSVAMESTGDYWQTLFSALQEAGFEVLLVNGGQVRNVKGKKTDVLDCLWIQKLHSLGLLSGSFLLSNYLQRLRTFYSHRKHLIEQTSKYINKMQKALRLMNVRLDVAIDDIMGKSGRRIIDDILAGERDPNNLALLADGRVKKSKQEIAAALEGQWRDDLLFELKSCLTLHDIFQKAIVECDMQMEKLMKNHFMELDTVAVPQTSSSASKKSKGKHAPHYNVRHLALSYFKTDLFEIPGVSHSTVLCLLSNLGKDIHKFDSSKRFVSWLRLAPNNKVSGGRLISSRTPKGKNAVALAFRQAANTVGNMKNHPLTPFFRRIAFRKGRISAITATARKLAIICFNMITKQQAYSPADLSPNIEVQKKATIKYLKKRLDKLKFSSDELSLLFPKYSLSAS